MLRIRELIIFLSLAVLCKGLNVDQLTYAARQDIVNNLPGLQNNITFKNYAGYLNGATEDSQLFYWLMESQSNPEKDPLVLWMNGGPGCSSLMAVLTEHGPFSIDKSKKLQTNPFAWNKNANVIYLEAPVGVGFSYSKTNQYETNDDKTADDNLGALKSFLQRFPQYKGRDFYITGESYGGVYVPTLAKRVVEDKTFKLKAVAIGNGLSSYEKNDDSLIYFAFNHGLISTRFWKTLLDACCKDQDLEKCRFSRNKEHACVFLTGHVVDRVNQGLNVYNLYSPCVGGVSVAEAANYTMALKLDEYYSDLTQSPSSAEEKAKLIKLGLPTESYSDYGNLFRNNLYVTFGRHLRNLKQKNVRLVIPCSDDTLLPIYYNDPAVKEALHVRPESLTWDTCSADLNERLYHRTYKDMSSHYHHLLSHKIPMLIYNGDVDMACNYLGEEWFLDDLGLSVKTRYRPWYYTDENQWKQVGGYTKIYSNGQTSINFVTVRGSGHMVPTDKPRPAFHIFSQFLKGGGY